MTVFPTVRWAEIDALFEQALDRPPDERTAFLRAHCGDDPALYHAVTGLLASDEAAERALGESAAEFAAHLLGEATAEPAESLAPGTRIGPYRIEGALGHGGMGVVYRTTRADGTFEKTVALKLVKRGMDTDEVLRRFRYERQILAGLEHPGIARLLDAGAADDGRPYLVMECVEGEPITAYADRHRLSVDERLVLFERVCEAVTYAHRRLVVHRDLKPSNILVTAEGEVKLLDFGIARLLEEQADADVPRTRPEWRILTPEYAAPEQLRGEPATTATDVYALGVVLYELLGGTRPGPEPKPPSTTVTPEVGAARSTTADRLRRRLRGDLDTLALAALHADPARRYASAEALLDDLRRWRTGLPLRARPDSTRYRLGKFVGRHRVGVAVSAVGLALLAAFVVALALQQRETVRERDRAEHELAQKAEVTDFLIQLFGAADPGEARGDTLNVYDVLDRGGERIETELADQPAVQGELLLTLSSVYQNLGDLERARLLAERSLAVHTTAFGGSHPAVAKSENHLGRVLEQIGDYEAAQDHLRRALALRQELLGPEDSLVAEATMNLGLLLTYSGAYDEAESLLRRALEIDRTLHGDEHADVATDLNNLAVLLYYKGDYAGAGDALNEALAIRRVVYGTPHPRVATTLHNLAAIRSRMGDAAEAEALSREVVYMTRQLHGDDHPELVSTLSNLAATVNEQGRHEEAEELVREAIDLGRRVYGEHPELADALSTWGNTLRTLERYDEAEAAYEEALAMNRTVRGADHPRYGLILSYLALTAAARGDDALAEQRFRDALAVQDEALPEDHDEPALTRSNLGALLTRLGRWEEAEPLLLRAYTVLENTYGGEDERVRTAAERLATLYEAWGRPDEAARYHALAEAGQRAAVR